MQIKTKRIGTMKTTNMIIRFNVFFHRPNFASHLHSQMQVDELNLLHLQMALWPELSSLIVAQAATIVSSLIILVPIRVQLGSEMQRELSNRNSLVRLLVVESFWHD